MNRRQGARNRLQTNRAVATTLLFVLILIFAPLAMARLNVDFDPGLDFSKFKTFAYIGGVNKLEFRPLDPNFINREVHAEVAKALIQGA